MIEKMIEKLFGSSHDREKKRIEPLVAEINRIYEGLNALTEEELKAKTPEFKGRIQERVGDVQKEIADLKEKLRATNDDEKIDHEAIRQEVEDLEKKEHDLTQEVLTEILPEAFAVVKETCRRLVGASWKVVGHDVTWDMIPYDVQLFGGIVLHEGKIAEMATGEGKTLVATMPLYLNALVGKGAHLVTVNDYLAQRDCEWMGEIFRYLGLTVAFITNSMDPSVRRKAYMADITYGTNNEFGFDYLRDNMAVSMEGVVQREHHYAIIDEVDSVLIDEARTPLIISGPVPESKNKFKEMNPRVEKLVRAQTNLVNKLVAEGEKLLEEDKEYEAGIKLLQAHRGAPKNKRLAKLYRESGVQKLIRRVESDYMRDKRLQELDEDLYYAMEEKSSTIDMTDLGRQYISPDDPEMFVLPDLATQLAELEGDEDLDPKIRGEQRDKLQTEYAEKSELLHNISQLLRAYSMFEKDVEYVVEEGKVMIVDEFTGRLMPGRRFSDGLHQALEAKENVKVERETQTMATITLQNFFRLYSKLAGMTGTAETEAGEFWEIYKLDVVVIPTNEPIRRADNDDLVFRTRREKYNAIIDEVVSCHEDRLPVLVGTISVEASETLSRMLKRRGIKHSVLNAKQHGKEAEIVSTAGEPGMVTIATNMAGRGTDIKLGAGVIRFNEDKVGELKKRITAGVNAGSDLVIHEIYDVYIDQFKTLVREAGGDPRVIQSREEKLALLKGEDHLPKGVVALVPKKLGRPTDVKQRRDGLAHLQFRNYAEGGLHIVGTERHEARRIDRQLRGRAGRQGDPGASLFFLSLEDDLMRLFAPERIINVMDRLGLEEGEVITHPMITKSIERAQKRVEMRNFEIRKHLLEYDNVMNKQREVIYTRRRRALEGENLHDDVMEMMEEVVYSAVEDATGGEFSEAWDWEGLEGRLIRTLLLPLPVSQEEHADIKPDDLTDRCLQAAKDAYNRKRRLLGEDLMGQLERYATLRTIDEKWKEQLYEMDRLKEGIGLRAYGQKDPLLEYKQEAFRAFSDMLVTIDEHVLELIFKMQIQVEGAPPLQVEQQRGPAQMATVHEEAVGMGFAGGGEGPKGPRPPQIGKPKPVHVEKKVGRNDPCPCGSGKKYKHCHGKG